MISCHYRSRRRIKPYLRQKGSMSLKQKETEFRTVRNMESGSEAGTQQVNKYASLLSSPQNKASSGWLHSDSSIARGCTWKSLPFTSVLPWVPWLLSLCGPRSPKLSTGGQRSGASFGFVLILHFRTPTGSGFHCSNGKVWKRVGTQKLPKNTCHRQAQSLRTKLSLIPRIINENIYKRLKQNSHILHMT